MEKPRNPTLLHLEKNTNQTLLLCGGPGAGFGAPGGGFLPDMFRKISGKFPGIVLSFVPWALDFVKFDL